MPRGWEGNPRSGVTLAMRQGLEWFIHLRAQRPRVGNEHPAYAPAGAWLPLRYLTCYSTVYMNHTHGQKRFRISEVAANWPQLISHSLRESTVCSQRTYHHLIGGRPP